MVTQLITSLVISRDDSTLLNTDRDKPDIGDDIAGDRPGMAGDTPIKGCGPTLGNKVGSYEGNDAILLLLLLYYQFTYSGMSMLIPATPLQP